MCFCHVPTESNLSSSSSSKSGNPPSALENALGAWKGKRQSTHLHVATQLDGADRQGAQVVVSPGMGNLMSPSAMSHDEPSDTPSDFTLTSSSRATPTTALSSSNSNARPHTHLPGPGRSTNLHPQNSLELHQQQHQHGRPPIGLESGDRGQLSSRPMLRNSSGNFLNLANLANEQHMSDNRTNGNHNRNGSTSDNGSKSTISTTDGKSTNSSVIS